MTTLKDHGDDEVAALYAWSTSGESSEVLSNATSTLCSTHLSLFFQDKVALSIATEASSHPTGLTALYYQPWSWAGGGLGNIAECPIQNCIAGAGIRRDSLTFASLCVVPQCTAHDLAADDFLEVVQRGNIGAADPILGREYTHIVERIAELNDFLGTGWICGDFVVPWTMWPFGYLFFVLAGLLLVGAAFGSFFYHSSSSMSTAHATTITRIGRSEEPKARDRESGLEDSRPFLSEVLNEEQNDTFSCQDEKQPESPLVPHRVDTALKNSNDWGTPFFRAFDFFANYEDLTLQKSKDTVILDGLRVGSLCWIIVGHLIAITGSVAGFSNPKEVYPPSGFLADLPGQLVISSRFAVDTFLIISGFLTFLVLNRKLKRQNHDQRRALHRWISSLPGLLLARVVRILPLYGMCLLFYTQVAPHLGGGPFWYEWLALLRPCHDYGWTNLLFVNNFVPFGIPTTATCFYHSWYLAVDMQLFLLSSGLVFWHQANPLHGKRATAAFWLISLGVSSYLAATRHWSVNTFDGAAVARYDVEAYAKPHVRAQSYLTGVFVAMLLPDRTMRRRSAFTWKHRTVQHFCLAAMLVVTFLPCDGAYDKRACQYQEWPLENDCGSSWSQTQNWTYTSISRTVWCVGIGTLLHLFLGRPAESSAVSFILSWKCWAPLSRLSFAAYLIHPIVICVWKLGNNEKEVFRPITFVMDILAVCVVSYLSALIATLCIEIPFGNVWKLLLTRKSTKEHKQVDWQPLLRVAIEHRPIHYGTLSTADNCNGGSGKG